MQERLALSSEVKASSDPLRPDSDTGQGTNPELTVLLRDDRFCLDRGDLSALNCMQYVLQASLSSKQPCP